MRFIRRPIYVSPTKKSSTVLKFRSFLFYESFLQMTFVVFLLNLFLTSCITWRPFYVHLRSLYVTSLVDLIWNVFLTSLWDSFLTFFLHYLSSLFLQNSFIYCISIKQLSWRLSITSYHMFQMSLLSALCLMCHPFAFFFLSLYNS